MSHLDRRAASSDDTINPTSGVWLESVSLAGASPAKAARPKGQILNRARQIKRYSVWIGGHGCRGDCSANRIIGGGVAARVRMRVIDYRLALLDV